MTPKIALYVDGKPVGTIEAPSEFGARDWILGVAAVQVFVDDDGRVTAQLRSNRTGAEEAELAPVPSGSIVCATFGDPSPAPATADPFTGDPVPGLRVGLDGAALAGTRAPRDRTRAFGHVFCRWMKDGTFEAGFDLTAFAQPVDGAKYERILSQALHPGQAVVYRFDS